MVPLACALLAASPALAVQYTFTALPFGFTAAALNDAGQVAGVAPPPSGGEPAAAVFANGALTFPVVPLANGLSFLTGINDAGDLLGETANGRSPFAIFGGVATGFAAPGNTSAGIQATGLNNQRQIVGSAIIDNGQGGVLESYVSSGGTYAVLTVPSAVPGQPTYTQAEAINDAGVVVGKFGPGLGLPNQQGFLDQAGTFTTILVPGSSGTEALAINDGGEIAGQYQVTSLGSRGFTDIGGVFSDITGPDGSTFLPVGLNNAGQLVGTFGGIGLSYLATPQATSNPMPEPGTAALLGGLAALGAVLRRRSPKQPVAVGNA